MSEQIDNEQITFDQLLSILSERRLTALPVQNEIIDMLIKLLGNNSGFDQEFFSRDSFCYWFLQQRGKRVQSRLEAVTRIADSSSVEVLKKLSLAHAQWKTAELFAVPDQKVLGFNHQVRKSIEEVLGHRGTILYRLLIDEEFERSNRT